MSKDAGSISAPPFVSAWDFGQRLRRLRKKKGYTQEGLARAADVSSGIIKYYEQKKKDPADNEPVNMSADLFLQLLDALGVDAGELYKPL